MDTVDAPGRWTISTYLTTPSYLGMDVPEERKSQVSAPPGILPDKELLAMAQKPVIDVLVKPAGPACNLACNYCFYRSKEQMFSGSKTRMNEEVLRAMLSQLLAQPVQHISIGWQGGEPTLMGVPFYQKAIELMRRFGRGQGISNGIQTNGLLINKQWAKLFREYHFLVGLSIDGPEHIHDHYRKTQNGKGTFHQAVGAAKLLLDSGVEVNVLTVVNNHSAQYPEEIYQSHKSVGLNYMQFIPCVETDPHVYQPASFSVSGEMYGKFLCTVFDLWLADFVDGTPTTSIRFFESLLFQYAGFSPTECTLADQCGNYLVVEHNGDVYACDFFVEPEWKLGNLLESPLVSMLNSKKQLEFGRIKGRLHADCLGCEWRQLCQGGCTKDRLRNPGSDHLNHFCNAFKMFFPHADPHFRRLVKEWKRKEAAQTIISGL